MSKAANKAGRKYGLGPDRRTGPTPIRFSLKSVRFSLWSMFLFSFVGGGISALGAIFVIQIYDRVLPAHSIPTLVVLAGIFLVFYIVHGILTAIIGRLGERTGLALLNNHEPTFLRLTHTLRRTGIPRHEAIVPLQNFREVVSAIRGKLLASIFDLTWVPILIVVLGFVSPFMAAFALGLIALHFAAALLPANREEDADGRPHELWRTSLSREYQLFAPPTRLARLVSEGLQRERSEKLTTRDRDRDMKGFAISLREIGHSGMLVVGAWLVLTDAMSVGAMIASGMLMMRILGPVQTILREKTPILAAYRAWQRLKTCDLSVAQIPQPPSKSDMAQSVLVSHLSLSPPKSEVKLGNTSFSLSAGQSLIVAGPSGSGKTLLLKRLCGIVGSKPGAVQIGDETLASINDERLSQIIGYVSQETVFPPGTVLEIIGKFSLDGSRDDVVTAAKRIGVHDAIMALDRGYETIIAPGEVPLPSTLLRQIAFVRAIIDRPAILLLDDPFRGLSTETARRMTDVIAELKAEGTIIIMAMPELSVTELADFAMILGYQKVLAFGPVSEVLALPPTRLMMRDPASGRRGGGKTA